MQELCTFCLILPVNLELPYIVKSIKKAATLF
jgi:hypothetical protein